jgi:hypothetical protein
VALEARRATGNFCPRRAARDALMLAVSHTRGLMPIKLEGNTLKVLAQRLRIRDGGSAL